jgi:hypothetical protein
MVQDRNRWRAVVNAVLKLRVLASRNKLVKIFWHSIHILLLVQ